MSDTPETQPENETLPLLQLSEQQIADEALDELWESRKPMWMPSGAGASFHAEWERRVERAKD